MRKGNPFVKMFSQGSEMKYNEADLSKNLR